MWVRAVAVVCVVAATASGIARFASSNTRPAVWLDIVFVVSTLAGVLALSRLLSRRAIRAIDDDLDRGTDPPNPRDPASKG